MSAVNDVIFGRIYKLYSIERPEVIYVGSTQSTLSARMKTHIRDGTLLPERRVYSFLNQFKVDTWRMELLQHGVCKTVAELKETEEWYRVELKATLNEQAAFVNIRKRLKNHAKHQRHYRARPKTRAKRALPEYVLNLKAKQRALYLKNREFRKAQQRDYYNKNRLKLLAQKSKYYKKNKQRIAAYSKAYHLKRRNEQSADGKKRRADLKIEMPAAKRMKVSPLITTKPQ